MRKLFLAAVFTFLAAMSPPARPQEAPKPATAPTPAASTPHATPSPNDYSNPDFWLCRPGREDACSVDLTTTIVTASGKLTRETWSANPSAPIDCFYVYPTISHQPTANSDMSADPEEKGVIRQQFARFASQCRPYAPIYRQVTLAALRAAMAGTPLASDRTLVYNDIRDAWNYYLEHDNKGRGVVLIGHSQGSNVLIQLIKREIDGKPIQARIVSALLLGASVQVPRGKTVGGSFQHMPLCESAAQTGCIVTYSSFRSNVPPTGDSAIGMAHPEGTVVACTNPAALGGGSGELRAYLSAHGTILTEASARPGPWVTPEVPIDTPFVSVPGMLTAECVSNDNGAYLAVTVHSQPTDARAKDIAGDVVVNGQVLKDWGLHLIDVNEAMGNLIELVREQNKAYTAAHAKL
ncbi:MAG TPA: DUF3089 domain-containing protein [Candidatus Acidoferrum sp.]|jgi:hypothetical protein